MSEEDRLQARREKIVSNVHCNEYDKSRDYWFKCRQCNRKSRLNAGWILMHVEELREKGSCRATRINEVR